jgi:hypothetical protein
MAASLDVVLPYVNTREQFGKRIGEFQVRTHGNKGAGGWMAVRAASFMWAEAFVGCMAVMRSFKLESVQFCLAAVCVDEPADHGHSIPLLRHPAAAARQGGGHVLPPRIQPRICLQRRPRLRQVYICY